MAKTRVFISFDYDNDARQKDLLVGQSKHPDTDFEFADWSSKEHLTGDWKAKIKAKLAYVDGGFKYEVQHGLTRRETPRGVS